MEINNKKKNNKYYYKNHNNHNYQGKKYYYKKKNNEKKEYVIHNSALNNEIEQQMQENEQTREEELNNILINETQNNEQETIKMDQIQNVIKETMQSNNEFDELEFVPIKKGMNKEPFTPRNTFKYALGLFIIMAIIFGVSYSFFNYTKEDTRQADIASGDVYVRIEEAAVNLTLNRMYPRTNEEARSRSDNYIDFTLKAKNTSETKEINYVLNITNGEDISGKTRINPQYLIVDLQEKVGNEYTYIKNAVPLSTFSFSGKVPVNTTSEITKEYRLRIWISDEVLISDTEESATYTQEEFSKLYANIHIEVNSEDKEKEPTGEEKLRKAITAKINAETNACNPIWKDDMGTQDESDDIIYFSGTNDCVDMNYVWYSGKLWRITAIYPDGSMKMVTEDALTVINWGSSVEYDGSWIYQWLNEDFYDTLVNPSDILISDATWNYSTDYNSTPVRPETIATQKTKEAPIGLLNAYEYYNSYRCVGSTACTGSSYSTGYLNIGYYWWLITPYSTSYVRGVDFNGHLYSVSPSDNTIGVRPSINLKSGLEFTGSGTKDDPYKIVGDKENPTSGTLISSRSIGEYVKFDGDNYRIVSIDEENGTTKLTRVDYLRDNGTVITKNFANTVYFGKNTNTQTDTYWDYYLNNTWYNNINTTYKNMLVDGTYYLGLYPSSTNYKTTICKDTASTLNSITIKNCTKYTSSDTNKIFTGKVGLSRVGEMFSAQLGSGYSTSSTIWTITPYSTSDVRDVINYGHSNINSPSSRAGGVRPSINLKSGIKITGGTGYVGGDVNSPFEISE